MKFLGIIPARYASTRFPAKQNNYLDKAIDEFIELEQHSYPDDDIIERLHVVEDDLINQMNSIEIIDKLLNIKKCL